MKVFWVDEHQEINVLSRGSLYCSNTKFFVPVKLFSKRKLILANKSYIFYCACNNSVSLKLFQNL